MKKLLSTALFATCGISAIAAGYIAVGILGIYWAIATCCFLALTRIVMHQWMPRDDRFIRGYVFLFLVFTLLAALAAVAVFRAHGSRAALVGVASLLSGFLGFELGARVWLSRWQLLRAYRNALGQFRRGPRA